MKNHPAGVAALAEVVRTTFSDLAQHGKVVSDDARAALALVDRWLAGEEVSADAFEAAALRAHQEGLPFAQREKDRVLKWANGAAANLAYTARKGRGWQDGPKSTMDAAHYALSSLRVEGTRNAAALEAIRAAAFERAEAAERAKPGMAGTKTKAKTGTRTLGADSAPTEPVPVADELVSVIGEVANAWLARVAPVFDPKHRVGDTALRKFLKARKYPAHAAVLAFDQRYGGLVAADEPGEVGLDWLFGAHACLASEAHVEPRGAVGLRGNAALVPVIYSPNDVIFYLDGHGAGWCEDTIEGGLERVTEDGDRLVSRLLLHQVLFDRSGRGLVAEIAGKRGEEAAAILGAPSIPQATDDLAHVWGSASALVFEERSAADAAASRGPWRTRVSAEDEATLGAVVARLAS